MTFLSTNLHTLLVIYADSSGAMPSCCDFGNEGQTTNFITTTPFSLTIHSTSAAEHQAKISEVTTAAATMPTHE